MPAKVKNRTGKAAARRGAAPGAAPMDFSALPSTKGHPYDIAELVRGMNKVGRAIRRTRKSAEEYLRTANLCGDEPVARKPLP